MVVLAGRRGHAGQRDALCPGDGQCGREPGLALQGLSAHPDERPMTILAS